MRYSDPPGCPDCMRAAVRLCPFIAVERHRRARADRLGAGMLPAASNAGMPDSWVLGITRRYRSVFVTEDGFTVYFPAPFPTIETYGYDAEGRISPTPTTR